ncbi:MAG: L,D-transpeptidase [Rhodovibrionaceae bacterium]
MTHRIHLCAATLVLALGAPSFVPPVYAADKPFTAKEIDGAVYDGGRLPSGQSTLTAKLQILLDRAHVSPGVIDGWKGGMSESAIHAFETREGLPADGVMDAEVWRALGGPDAGNLTRDYRITEEDTAGLNDPLPDDYAELAKLERLGFVRVSERLAERFHMDEDFLLALNPEADFEAGETIAVADPGQPLDAAVSRIEISKSARRLAAFDEAGKMVANYPVAVGSTQTPSPTGTHGVSAIALNPTYSYNPDVNFQQGDNSEQLLLAPGANGPVGLVWIDLDKPTYGIHGTSDPSKLFKEFSHGCVRMTNWDGSELAEAIDMSSSVIFVE